MNDIQKTLAEAKGDIINMSAGNPVILPELEHFWREKTREVVESQDFWEIVGRYWSTKWYGPLLESAVKFANTHYTQVSWWWLQEIGKRSEENILVTSGSQSFYFFAICNPLYFLCEKNTLYFSYIFQSVFNFLEGVFLVSQLLFFCAVFFSFFSLVLLYLFIHGSGVGNP